MERKKSQSFRRTFDEVQTFYMAGLKRSPRSVLELFRKAKTMLSLSFFLLSSAGLTAASLTLKSYSPGLWGLGLLVFFGVLLGVHDEHKARLDQKTNQARKAVKQNRRILDEFGKGGDRKVSDCVRKLRGHSLNGMNSLDVLLESQEALADGASPRSLVLDFERNHAWGGDAEEVYETLFYPLLVAGAVMNRPLSVETHMPATTTRLPKAFGSRELTTPGYKKTNEESNWRMEPLGFKVITWMESELGTSRQNKD